MRKQMKERFLRKMSKIRERISQIRTMPIEKKFLFVAATLGSLFIVLLLPGQSPDEINHFERAYAISEGVFVPEVVDGKVGGWFPDGVADDMKVVPEHGGYKDTSNRLRKETTGYTYLIYSNTALYNFVCYIPQTVAILIGKMLSFSVLGMAYLARVFNFAIWILLVYLAIKLIPKYKKIMTFVALLPITLQEAASMSPDALSIGLGMFLVAFVLYLTYTKKGKMTARQLAVLFAIGVVIGLCKIVYLPLVLMYLIIPAERFGSRKRKWVLLSVMAVVVAGINSAWLAIASGLLVENMHGAVPKEQIGIILSDPIRYIITIYRTIDKYSVFWMATMLGQSLGAFVINLPQIVIFSSFAILVLLFGQRDEILEMKNFDRLVAWVVFLGTFGLILTSLYIQWTELGAEVIDGVQGRYFLPILMLIPLMIFRSRTKKRGGCLVSEKLVVNYSLVVGLIACATIFMQNI